MIRAVLLAAALATAALVVDVPASSAAGECKGLQVCIPVAGPWVVIPLPAASGSASATWRLVCPQGVVGGTDAFASERAVAVEFPGRLGSPVNPGITTTRSLVFKGTYAGAHPEGHELPAVHRLHPRRRRGPRTPMAFRRVSAIKPGEPITTRAKTLRVEAGSSRG